MASKLNFDCGVLFPPQEEREPDLCAIIATKTQELYQNTSPPLFLDQRELEEFAFDYYDEARKDVAEFPEIDSDDVKRIHETGRSLFFRTADASDRPILDFTLQGLFPNYHEFDVHHQWIAKMIREMNYFWSFFPDAHFLSTQKELQDKALEIDLAPYPEDGAYVAFRGGAEGETIGRYLRSMKPGASS